MRHLNIYVMLVAVAISSVCVEGVMAQNHQERKVVREGNEAFNNGDYRQSLDLYNEALEIAPNSMEATYNRANAYHHVMRTSDGKDSTISWKQSNKLYEDMLSDDRMSDAQRAEVLRNIGESLMTQQEYEAALNAFRESLLLNADDAETKYNYVLAKRIVDQMRRQNEQNQDQNQNQEQNDNQQGGGDGNDDQNQDGGDNQNQNGNDNQNQDGEDGQNQDSGNNQDDNQSQDQDNDDNQNQGDGDDKRDEKEQGSAPDNGGDEKQDGDDESEQRDGQSPSNGEPEGLSDEQERLLDAMQGEEDKTQEKLNKAEAAVYAPGKKNW